MTKTSTKPATNYYREYKEINQALEEAEIVNMVSSIIFDHINHSNLENKPSIVDLYLQTTVELYANILEELNYQTQKDVQNFVDEMEKENGEKNRIPKMIYIILSFASLQGIALKKLAMNLTLWLNLDKDVDLSNLQAELYNLAVEIEYNQKVFANL